MRKTPDAPRKARKTSPARARASRINGRAGGAYGKKGGRPRKHRFPEVFAKFPDPPDDPLELPGWTARIMAIVLKETLLGRGNDEIARTVRTTSATIAKTIPFERLAQAERRIRGAGSPSKPPAASGPQVVKRDEVAAGASSRRAVRR